MSEPIYHIVAPAVWQRAVAAGQYVPDGFDRDGFVHFSYAHQVARVANAIYRDEPELIVVAIDPSGLPLVVEDCYEAGEEFPHVYAPIPTAAQVGAGVLTRNADGDWEFRPDA